MTCLLSSASRIRDRQLLQTDQTTPARMGDGARLRYQNPAEKWRSSNHASESAGGESNFQNGSPNTTTRRCLWVEAYAVPNRIGVWRRIGTRRRSRRVRAASPGA